MSEDKKDNERDFNDIIRKIFEQAIKNGKFPFNENFSITIAGGRLPVEMIPSNNDSIKNNTINNSEDEFILNNPHTEVHQEDDSVVIYANIPGSDMSNTAISVNGNILYISSFTDGIKHFAEVKIPDVRKETMKYKFNNGVLEISVKSAD
ncbi:MAG: Hsp20/alpha crystallin family protein [Methanomicrobium sp.]|nr:Hsp20/alpha crystallin family protein [Methanomicrobium sp.]